MNIRYIVELNEEERAYLKALIKKGNVAGYRIRHAQILLKLDDIAENRGLTQTEIGQMYGSHRTTFQGIGQRFVEEGLESALNRKEQQNRRRKIDGEVEAHMVAISCSSAPEGRERWTLKLIADELVRLEVVDSISPTAVGTTLKKTNSSHGAVRNGVSRGPQQNT